MSKQMRKIFVWACLITLAAIIGCKPQESTTSTSDTAAPPERQAAAEPVRLNQGWSAEQAERFYYTPQGSQLIPYTWFLALEVEKGETLFRDNAHMERLGYLTVSAKSANNPDALPVGLVAESGVEPMLTAADDYGSPTAPLTGAAGTEAGSTKWLGLTCAACHTGDLHHGGKVFRIDGGPPMVDHETFVGELALSLQATHTDQAKFDRFAKRVLGGGGDPAKLKTDLVAFTESFKEAVARNKAPHPYGFARLDAFGAIFNQVAEVALKIPGNHAPSDAPVSFPFLWQTPHLDWVQWNGSVDNPLGRNVGEVMGVYGSFTLFDDPKGSQFSSSVKIGNLAWMEEQVAALTAPEWPAADFGAIDTAKADAGKKLYEQTCVKCHFVRDASGSFPMTPKNKFGKQFIQTVMVPVEKIGTDPMMVKRFVRIVDPGVLRPLMGGAAKVPAAKLLGVADGGVIKRALGEMKPPPTPEQILAMMGFRDPDIGPPNPIAYKARPLDGIWATAPYLHAGSVPNLYQLLLPAKDRVKSFHVGSREFDPVDIGLSTKPFPGSFEFRTVDANGAPIPGNSNAGHEGPDYTQISNRDFTDEERRALIEYMKTLK